MRLQLSFRAGGVGREHCLVLPLLELIYLHKIRTQNRYFILRVDLKGAEWKTDQGLWWSRIFYFLLLFIEIAYASSEIELCWRANGSGTNKTFPRF